MTRACDECLRRALLLERLAPYIERVATGEAGQRSPELLALEDERLVRAVGERRADGVLAASREPAAVARVRRRAEAAHCWVTCRHGSGYPAPLRELGGEAPAALFGRGSAAVVDELDSDATVTIVGARRAGAYGLGVAEQLGRMLARASLLVVSGLANGIDSRAHRGALDGRGRTVAVLGGGVDVPYPRRQAALYRRILNAGGTVVSELPPGAPSFRWCFPARNRIMAALGGITVVVAAAERSGSLITAGMALDLGRSVGAVPGPVNSWLSAGANQLLVDGAVPVRDAQDVLDHLLGAGSASLRDLGPDIDASLRKVLECVEAGHATCDAIALAAGVPAHSAATALARLELLGYVDGDHVGRHTRTALRAPDPRRSQG